MEESRETMNRSLGVAVLIILAIALFGTCSKAHAQGVTGFVEFWNTVEKSDTTPQVNVYAKGPIKGKVGWTLWTLTTQGWSEANGGLTFAPASWMEVSWSAGIETNEEPFRHSSTLWMGKGRFAVLVIYEDGGSGPWHRVIGTYQATKNVTVGVNSIRFFGTGPYIERRFGKVSVWGAWAVDNQKGAVTARLSF